MERKRIIARLDIKNSDLVKGIQLEGLRVLGNPIDAAQYYYEQQIDELFLVDVVASLYERNGLSAFIKEISKEVFVPITVAGGLRTLADIRNVLACGADKVALNTAALRNTSFLKESINEFGSSTIAVNIEVSSSLDGQPMCFTDNGREYTGKLFLDWISELCEYQVGEIIITSIDNDGTGKGIDKQVLSLIPEDIQVPIVYHGGPSNIDDIVSLFEDFPNVDGIALASLIHYNSLNEINSSKWLTEGNNDFLQKLLSEKSFHRFENTSVSNIKSELSRNGISVR